MSDQSNRIICPYCKTNNFKSSAVCWQCGKPLQAAGQPDQQPPYQPQGPQPPAQQPPPPPYQPPAQQTPKSPPYQPYGQQPGQPYQPPSGGPQQPYPPPTAAPPASDTKILIILGFVFAGLGLCCCGPLGIGAIIMGVIAHNKGDKLGIWVIVAGAAALLLGIISYFAFGSITDHLMQQMMKQGGIPDSGFPSDGGFPMPESPN